MKTAVCTTNLVTLISYCRLCEETSNTDNLTGNTEEATRNEPTSQETGTTVGEGEKTNSNIKKPSATQVKGQHHDK